MTISNMMHITPIDPHVHLRWTEYEFPYMPLALQQAHTVGLAALLEMPNTTPPLVDSIVCKNRNNITSPTPHWAHIGLTSDTLQIVKALDYAKKNKPYSDKIYYTHSTGNMGLSDLDLQKWIWKLKVNSGYTGVSIGHFEDEALWLTNYDPTHPVTHSIRQSEASETVQVLNQLRNAMDANFRGTFYVAHVSSPDTLALLEAERLKHRPFQIVAEVTWHHLFLNWDDYAIHGNRVKMNPPLRPKGAQERLLEMVLKGAAQVIGTDHAPHSIERKDDKINPASGIPAIPFWPAGVQMLEKLGIEQEHLWALTWMNAETLFKLEQKVAEYAPLYRPEMWEDYGFNPFSRVDKSCQT